MAVSSMKCAELSGSADPPIQPSILVVGYGNEWRGDDGCGPAVARAIADLDLPGVRSEVLPQLLPELAMTLATVESVVFVDASISLPPGCPVRTRALRARSVPSWNPHLGTPESLLALTQALHGRHPRAWCVEIPAGNLGWNAELSVVARAGVAAAVAKVRQLCAKPRPPQPRVGRHSRRKENPCTRPAS